MTVPPGPRRLALTAHVVFSVGWVGAVAGFLALATIGLVTPDEQLMHAAYVAMEPITRLVIVPFASAALLTGLVSSLISPWGLFRHYWVVVKLVVTLLVGIVLLVQLASISHVAEAAREGELAGAGLRESRISLVAHAGGGVLVLLVPTVLGVHKPRGLTGYGQRTHRDQHRARQS